MIILENLTKIYKMGDSKVVGANGINLQIYEGEFVSIMGPSGSGKSTLLHLIGGLDRPTSGRVSIEGVDITKLNYSKLCDLRKDKIGFIFQNFNLLPTLNALENVFVPLVPEGISNKKKEFAKELLEKVGLKDRMYHTPNQLSGGQQQRVAIARAFVNNPKIILADEPTGNLDTNSGKEVIKLMQDINRKEGVTIIIVTHDHNIGKETDRTIYLQDGEVIKDDLRNELVPEPSTSTPLILPTSSPLISITPRSRGQVVTNTTWSNLTFSDSNR